MSKAIKFQSQAINQPVWLPPGHLTYLSHFQLVCIYLFKILNSPLLLQTCLPTNTFQQLCLYLFPNSINTAGTEDTCAFYTPSKSQFSHNPNYPVFLIAQLKTYLKKINKTYLKQKAITGQDEVTYLVSNKIGVCWTIWYDNKNWGGEREFNQYYILGTYYKH